MKVISIGSDRKLFDEKSDVLSRLSDYASKMDSLHVIVFTKVGYKEKSIGNLHIYPTNSLSRLLYVFDAKKLAKKIIKEKGLSGDVVVTTQDPFETGLVGYFIHRKFSFPFQVQVHTDFLSSHFKKGFLNNIRSVIAKFLVPKAQGIRVVSEVIKDSIKEEFPKLKIEPIVLPIFVDIENIINYEPKKNIEKEFPQFKFIIFMASRLTKEKRIDIALDALRRVIGEFHHTGLVIAGSGSELRHLKRKAHKKGVSKNVVFVGWQDDLISYFKTTDLFLLTSEYEGYGMTLIEAGASGCPIVTTKVGIAKTSIFKSGENCYVCNVNDSQAISESILKLIHDNSTRELYKYRMRESIKSISFPIEEYVSKYVDLLSNLLIKK